MISPNQYDPEARTLGVEEEVVNMAYTEKISRVSRLRFVKIAHKRLNEISNQYNGLTEGVS